MSAVELRKSEMMAHLLDALSKGEDIGHYGRLVFVMVARHFLSEAELSALLEQDPDVDGDKARALIEQVTSKDYSPPSRDKVLEFQQHQDFPICPNPEDPDGCNVYKDLKFPSSVYDSINEYYFAKADAES
jgi:hypothetical protein